MGDEGEVPGRRAIIASNAGSHRMTERLAGPTTLKSIGRDDGGRQQCATSQLTAGWAQSFVYIRYLSWPRTYVLIASHHPVPRSYLLGARGPEAVVKVGLSVSAPLGPSAHHRHLPSYDRAFYRFYIISSSLLSTSVVTTCDASLCASRPHAIGTLTGCDRRHEAWQT